MANPNSHKSILNYMRSAFLLFRGALLPVALAVSLATNGALLLSNSFLGMASIAVSAATGRASAVSQQADEIVRLKSENAAEKKAAREAQSKLAEVNAELVVERTAKRKLRSELAESTAEVAALSTVNKAAKLAANDAATKISKRTQKAAAREVAAMPAEALPWLGTAVIVSATTLELADMCATMKDMTTLQRALDPSFRAPQEEAEVCGMQVPTRSEIWEAAKEAPGKVWEASLEAMPTAEELKEIDVSEIDWDGIGGAIRDKAKGWGDAAAATAKSGLDKIKHWNEN